MINKKLATQKLPFLCNLRLVTCNLPYDGFFYETT